MYHSVFFLQTQHLGPMLPLWQSFISDLEYVLKEVSAGECPVVQLVQGVMQLVEPGFDKLFLFS